MELNYEIRDNTLYEDSLDFTDEG